MRGIFYLCFTLSKTSYLVSWLHFSWVKDSCKLGYLFVLSSFIMIFKLEMHMKSLSFYSACGKDGKSGYCLKWLKLTAPSVMFGDMKT